MGASQRTCFYALVIVGAGIVNAAALFLTNSCTLIGRCPVSISTSSDILSNRPARWRSIARSSLLRWYRFLHCEGVVETFDGTTSLHVPSLQLIAAGARRT
jgi:hypothetical protein